MPPTSHNPIYQSEHYNEDGEEKEIVVYDVSVVGVGVVVVWCIICGVCGGWNEMRGCGGRGGF